MTKAVLCWDIDGTLLSTGRAGIFAWEDSFYAATHKRVSLADFKTAGLTDVEISHLLADQNSHNDPSLAQEILAGYLARLADSLPRRVGSVLPGIVELQQRIQSRPDIFSMLLTGNTKKGAYTKLAYYGLDHFFDKGAFSDQLPDRVSIAKKAVEIVKNSLSPWSNKDIFVIGDTPHDVSCGKAINAKTVAVCTGAYDRKALSEHQPDYIFDTFENTDQFFIELGLLA